MASLLEQVALEWRRSSNYNASELEGQRLLALNYYKGDVSDVLVPEKRSRAVSMDVSEAIDAFMPDAIEVFTGSDDAVVFEPQNAEDEEAARQETDYINYVFFKENKGFLILHDFIKDAVQVKTGVVKVVWREYYTPDERYDEQPLDQFLMALHEYGERVVLDEEFDLEAIIAGLSGAVDVVIPEAVSYTIKGEKRGKACVENVPPEDFGVSEDTVRLCDSPYHWHRTRVRAYELINRGISRKKVDKLASYGIMDTQLQIARSPTGQQFNSLGGDGDQRIVEVIEHYLLTPKGRKRVLTDSNANIELESEDHDDVCFAAMSPYPVAHQFYGQSIADKLLEIQRIKTVLTRMFMDSGNFALNQRMAVNMDRAHEWTVRDIMANEPNRPIRVKGPVGEALSPVMSGGINFDMVGALEYMSVQGEQRSGVMRNAQGLSPDTLHDTAKGASILLSAAQKRTRMICRVFAETGIKDMFLILHRVIRENADRAETIRLRNKWVELDPSSWGIRNDMSVMVGVGSGGREQRMFQFQKGYESLQGLIAMQGGANGPLVTQENVYNFMRDALEQGLEFRSADAYLSNPEDQPPQEPQQDPAIAEAEAKMALEQQKIEAQRERDAAQIETQRLKAEADIETERMKASAALELERERAEMQMQVEREKAAMQAQLAREKAEFEAQLARDKAATEAQLARERAALDAELTMARDQAMSRNRPGGDLDK